MQSNCRSSLKPSAFSGKGLSSFAPISLSSTSLGLTGLAFTSLTLTTLALCGCQTPNDYREQADQTAYDIIKDKQQLALGRNETFTVDKPADTLRLRLLTSQNLPVASPESLGISALDAIDNWPQDQYLSYMRLVSDQALIGLGDQSGLDESNTENPTPTTTPATTPAWIKQATTQLIPNQAAHSTASDEQDNQVMALTLQGALMLAAASNRNYQTQKENLFRTALALDLERHEFRTTFAGSYRALLASNPDTGNGNSRSTLGQSAEVGANRQFKNGIDLSSALALDLAQLLGSNGVTSKALNFDASVSIPLLRGAGEHIVTEPLIQAERDTAYAIWDFERFKRSFAVDIASQYIGVLQQQDQVRNATTSYQSFISTTRRAVAMRDEGRMSAIDVGQAEQSELNARSRWITAIQRYRSQLDNFKITLGLPPDAQLVLVPTELARLAEQVQEHIPLSDVINRGDATDDPSLIKLAIPTRDGAGPMELDETDAIYLAFANRLDLKNAIADVYDAQRDVVVASDGFLTEMTLFGSARVGSSRSGGSAGLDDDMDLNFKRGTYDALLTLDLPFDRTSERNTYRNALIALERAVRNLQDTEDQVKSDVRNLLRDLELAREQVRVQAKALSVAQIRVDQAEMSQEAGRDVSIRDVNDSKEDLIDAQNNLTSALIAYRIAEWELQRDTGILQASPKGVWEQLDATRINQLVQAARDHRFDPTTLQTTTATTPGSAPVPGSTPAPRSPVLGSGDQETTLGSSSSANSSANSTPPALGAEAGLSTAKTQVVNRQTGRQTIHPNANQPT